MTLNTQKVVKKYIELQCEQDNAQKAQNEFINKSFFAFLLEFEYMKWHNALIFVKTSHCTGPDCSEPT